MEKADLQQLARQVLVAYESKDIRFFEAAFDEDVVLRDWNMEVSGRAPALKEFSKNFNQAESLKINILQIFAGENRVAVELQIEINKQESLNVVDVIGFNDDGKISSIVAYRGL